MVRHQYSRGPRSNLTPTRPDHAASHSRRGVSTPPRGSDQGIVAAGVLGVDARVIAPARPGYLGTPLSTGRTPREKADAMVALLDARWSVRSASASREGG